MMDNENAIIRMIKSGARGFVLKDAEPADLRQALYNVYSKGYHYSELVSSNLIFNINFQGNKVGLFPANHYSSLSTREIDFLKYACTELTYREIADKMHVSLRTIDGYRDGLFEKLAVRTRVGLAIYAVNKSIVTIGD